MAVFQFQAPLKRVKPKDQNPRAVVTGTSLEASGHAEPTPDTSNEQGSSYVTPDTGPPIETVPQLTNAYQRRITYAQMMNDSSVDVSVRAWKTPVLGADFYVDPYSDSPLDLEVAQFVEANLLGGTESPFLDSLQDILHFCEDGFAVLEKVYENREWTPPIIELPQTNQGANATQGANNGAGATNGSAAANGASGQGSGNSGKQQQFRNTKVFTMLKSLAFRPASTIGDIEYDNNGRLTQLTQSAIQSDKTSKDVPIKADKLLIFTLNRKGGDITGKSVLRSAYPHWYYKTHFYKIDAIQKERHGIGVPRGKLLPGYTELDKIALRNMLKNLRTNEEAFILQTPNVEIDFAELKGQLVNVLESAEHHNNMILLNVMATFLALGSSTQGGGGSRAVGATQSDMFMKSLAYIADYICGVINHFVIPELVVYNYKTTSFPKFACRGIGETKDLQQLGSALANLFAQEALTRDLPTEQWLRKVLDMPKKTGGIDAYPPVTRETIQVIGQPPDSAGGNGHSSTTKVTQGGTKGDVAAATANPTKGQGNSGKPPIGNS
jgi:hypothetical protein